MDVRGREGKQTQKSNKRLKRWEIEEAELLINERQFSTSMTCEFMKRGHHFGATSCLQKRKNVDFYEYQELGKA